MTDINPTPEQTDELISESQTEIDNVNATGTEQEGEPAEKVNYKTKFAESTSENQRILAEQKDLQSQLEEANASLTELKDSQRTLETKFKEDNPEGYDKVTLEREMSSLKEKVAISEEESKLARFVGSDDNKAKHSEALKALARANPRRSFNALWEENFAPFYVDKKAEINSQPETGEGTLGEEMPTGGLPKGFNTWPLEKRSAWFEKTGNTKM